MKKLIQIVFLFLIVFSILSCKTEKQKDEEIMTALVARNYSKARVLVRKHYQNDRQKALGWMLAIQDEEDEDYLDFVQIEEGWKWTFKGDYSYIRGRVKNTGDQTIRYYKITAHYKDAEKNVIDTDFTNSNDTLGPGMSKEFEIMHRRSPEYEYASINVEEVSIK